MFNNTTLIPPSGHQEQAVDTSHRTEVVGPVEASYLNQIATFRLARLEVRTPGETTTPLHGYHELTRRNSMLPFQQSVEHSTQEIPISSAIMNPMQETLVQPLEGQTQALPSTVNNFLSGHTASIQSLDLSGSVPPFNEDYYLRMAEEISDYMTWDGYLQTWSDFPGGDHSAL